MTPIVSASTLRLRVMLLHASAVALVAGAVLLMMAGTLAWTLNAVWRLERERAAQAAHARISAPATVPIPSPKPGAALASDNVAAFYGALGGRRYAGQQVRTLFNLAAKSGLVLRQGEYKPGHDRTAHLYTYQVRLPVKGSYDAIWKFALDTLRVVPFASLDEITFHRDAIGDPAVEARLRLTFYLRDEGGER